MPTEVKQQVIAEIRSFPMFAVQLDESTDVASCSQLLVFLRYIRKENVKEEFLYCNSLETTTTAQDVMNAEVRSGKSFVAYIRMEPWQCFGANLVSK